MPTTQRAYTLRLTGTPDAMRALWATHAMFNRATAAFADLLLTIRAGLPPQACESAEDKRFARCLLALCWLTVESDQAEDHHRLERGNVVSALRDELLLSGLDGPTADEWLADCRPSLEAAIGDNRCWVNRRRKFKELHTELGLEAPIPDDEAARFLCDILDVTAQDLLHRPKNPDDPNRTRETAREFRQKARNWLSQNWGDKPKNDLRKSVDGLRAMLATDLDACAGRFPSALFALLLEAIGENPQSGDPLRDIAAALGWKSGAPNKARVQLKALLNTDLLSQEDCARTRTKLADQLAAHTKKLSSVQDKSNWSWLPSLRPYIERHIGAPYRLHRDHTGEFGAALDHALRRISSYHSWIRRRELERSKFDEEARQVQGIDPQALHWLEEYRERCGQETGSAEPIPLRARAIQGWNEVVAAWSDPKCATPEDRIRAVRELQEDVEKWGDTRLFENLAREDAEPVWRPGGAPDDSILNRYVKATSAESRRARFLVPAYQKPDANAHPVFCEFGKSRWNVAFDIHAGARDGDAKRKLSLELWDGEALRKFQFRWQSKRLARDLAIDDAGQDEARPGVSRADRLGRAAAGAEPEQPVRVLGLYEQEEWNARLQAPREQLEDAQDGAAHPLGWFITFSPKLRPQPNGPYPKLAAALGAPANGRTLPHVPGLRILSVDLGHRVAAACAVWETVSASGVADLAIAAGQAPPDASAIHHRLNSGGRNWVYRRVGEHLWARLERQFVIRLQGEDRCPRKIKPGEKEKWSEHLKKLGFQGQPPTSNRVTVWMRDFLFQLRRAIARHARIAGACNQLHAEWQLHPGGRATKADAAYRKNARLDGIVECFLLAGQPDWDNEFLLSALKAHIPEEALTDALILAANPIRRAKKTQIAEHLRQALDEIGDPGADELSRRLERHWNRTETAMREALRFAKQWLMPRPSQVENLSEIRGAGGISLDRISNLVEMRKLQKSFVARQRPGDPQVADAGDGTGHVVPSTVAEHFGQRSLLAVERLRENRAKQLASRICAAALGLDKDLKSRPGDPTFAPCHAVVTEFLDYYRPKDTRLRSENRRLMSWTSARIKKYLQDACELNGQRFHQVGAAHTSRQDSRTGAPGMRCRLVDPRGSNAFWQSQLRQAQKSEDRDVNPKHLYVLAANAIGQRTSPGTKLSIVFPDGQGPFFLSASSQQGVGLIHADLNAAANIGLRAVMDPDWPGAWWKVPVNASSGKPAGEAAKAACMPKNLPLRARTQSMKTINLWADPSLGPIDARPWLTAPDYWRTVEEQIYNQLLKRIDGDDPGPF